MSYLWKKQVDIERPIIDRTSGSPKRVGFEKVYFSVNCHIQPRITALEESVFGRFQNATHLLVCSSIYDIRVNDEVIYKNERYIVLEVLKYEKHLELILQKKL